MLRPRSLCSVVSFFIRLYPFDHRYAVPVVLPLIGL
jgi:hypothetical protein